MEQLLKFVENELQRPVPAAVTALALHIKDDHGGAVAILAYGSSLRDVAIEDTLIDYYVVVETSEHLSSNFVLRYLGEVIPPNVCYAEANVEGKILRSKYALITTSAFENLMTARNPYLWARFTQPSRLVWVRDNAGKESICQAVATAMRTAFGHGQFLSATNPWVVLFQNTYRTELRPESVNRAAAIVATEVIYYRSIASLLIGTSPIASSWAAKRVFGKLWSLARLAKNAFTFAGGADYAAWKIERHSGVKIEVTDWQRRHPFLAGLIILPKLLLRKGLR